MNALRRLGIKPFYSPRRDMPERVRMAFQCGADTDMIATIFGYPESSIERWLHQTANQFEETQGEEMKAGKIVVVDDPGEPKTPEEKRRAMEWFKGAIEGFEERNQTGGAKKLKGRK